MRTIDCHYTISDERLIAYARVPLVERLRWLEELACFTQMWRAAPLATTHGAEPLPAASPSPATPTAGTAK